MSGYASPSAMCPHCGMGHSGTCPRIKAIEYYQDGTIKRVEFHAPQSVMMPISPPVDLRRAFES